MRALAGLFLLLGLLIGGGLPARAADPLFTFVQISDSQPNTEVDWALFQRVLDTLATAGSPGALIPRPIDFVLFAGDLVSHAKRQEEWVRFVDAIDASLTENAIPYRAVPGNHDVDAPGIGIGFYEFFIGDSGVWDTDSATIVGQNGPAVHTGWSGLRIIGFNNSNGDWNQISPEDVARISERVTAAAAAGENAFLLGHHPHDDQGVIPLASVLENPTICCYGRGHSGSVGARRGLASIANPDVWDLNSNKIMEQGALLYYEVHATELRVHALQLATNPTALPAAKTVRLAHPLVPVLPVPPEASFSANPTSGAAPLAVAFRDLSTGAPTSWLWTFGDGATSTQQNPSHTYPAAGVYDVSLRAANAAGEDTRVLSGLVTALPPPPSLTFSAVADAQVRSSSPARNYGADPELRIRAGDPTYRSYLLFGVSGLGGAAVVSAKLRLFTTDGSDDGGSLHAVAVDWAESAITWANAPPIGGAPLAGPAPVVAGLWREIDVTSLVGGDGTYAFALESASSNSAYYSSREGTGAPQLVVQIAPPAVPLADFSAAPTQGPAPLVVQFNDLSSNAPTSWLWEFGDGAVSTLQNPSHSYLAPGEYDVTLTASNPSGSDTFTRSAFVQVTAPAPTVRTLVPSADTKVGAAKPTRNYGADPDLRVKADAWRSYLRFDVAGLGAPVRRATLRLFANEGARDGGGLYAVTGAWSEAAITWDTAPPLQGAPIARLGPVATDTWVEIDVTATIAGEGSYSFGLDSAASVSVYYASRESESPPELVIELAP